jgi:hypothetical protein
LEEALFYRIERKLRLENLYEIGINILLSMDKSEDALDIYKNLIETYIGQEKSLPDKASKREQMMKALKYMEEHMNEPIKFRVPESERVKAGLANKDMFSIPKQVTRKK